MDRELDMLQGDIGRTLLTLSWPIILTNLIQTALGIIDMIWIGRLGSGAVSGVGSANIFINFGFAVMMLVVTGSGVRVAQSLGQGKEEESERYVKNALFTAFFLSLIFVLIIRSFDEQLIGFFKIEDPLIVQDALAYLRHSLWGMPFLFIAGTYVNILTSYGNTRLTFKANSIGLITNIILDPIFIFGMGFIPAMGVAGAAWATNIARIIISLILYSHTKEQIHHSLSLPLEKEKIMEMLRMGLPVSLQRFIFNFISMFMAKIVVGFGTDAMAAQRIGIQIESITYVTIGGLQGAISAFVGQNYGNKNIERVGRSYEISVKLVGFFGLIVSLAFWFFADKLFAIFISEPAVIQHGVLYMRALAFSQIFMGLEILTVGAFHGIGKTNIPSIFTIIMTISRIPLALFLSSKIGINGVWWSISTTSIINGIVLSTLFFYIIHQYKKKVIQ